MMQEVGIRYVRAGHEVHHIVPGPLTTSALFNGIHTHTIASPTIPWSGGYRMIFNLGAVKDILNQTSPDYIEISDRATLIPVGTWAQKRGVTAVAFAHERIDGALKSHLRFLPSQMIADLMNRWAVRHINMFVATTTYASEELQRIDLPYVKIPLGVDTELFSPKLRQTARNPITKLVLCSRLSKEKRCDFAIDLVRHLIANGVNVQLTIVGDGPLRDALEASATDLPVRFLGFISNRNELASLLANADAVLAPGPIETFGLAALESLASGTPVIVNSESALPEVVGEAGWAEPLEVEHWRSALQEILDEDEDAIRHQARKRAEDFSWDSTAFNLLALHENLQN